MPVSWDAATYAAAYRTRCRTPGHTAAVDGHDQGDYLTYGRAMMDHGRSVKYEMFRDLLIDNFGVGDRVLIAGCGFGYTIEAFHDAGFPWVGGIEVSDHINANRGIETRGDVLWIENDLRNVGVIGSALRKLQQDLGVPGSQRSSRWDWLISESMIEGYSDAELPGLLDDAEIGIEPSHPTSRIVHMVHTDPPSQRFLDTGVALNVKTFAEWVAVRPSHSWQEVTGARLFHVGV